MDDVCVFNSIILSPDKILIVYDVIKIVYALLCILYGAVVINMAGAMAPNCVKPR